MKCFNCGSQMVRGVCRTCGRVARRKKRNDRRVYCDIAGSDITIVEDSKDNEIRLICPHAKRFNGYGWYRIDCKMTETFFSIKKCGIFEGMRRFR